jgi:sec-independent protein translocase protein TatA
MGISWVQLLIILVIVLLVFGTKRVRTLGSDLGGAIREFRKGVSDDPGDEPVNGVKSRDESADRAHFETGSPNSDKPKD